MLYCWFYDYRKHDIFILDTSKHIQGYRHINKNMASSAKITSNLHPKEIILLILLFIVVHETIDQF